MAEIIRVTIMSQPGDVLSNPPSPSYVGGIATDIITSIKPYLGPASKGINAVINVAYSNGRTLRLKGSYGVNEDVDAVITAANA